MKMETKNTKEILKTMSLTEKESTQPPGRFTVAFLRQDSS
jgi:hypothetical protein